MKLLVKFIGRDIGSLGKYYPTSTKIEIPGNIIDIRKKVIEEVSKNWELGHGELTYAACD